MIPICEEIEVLTNPVQLKEDEYLNESGLIFCKKCRTPRQKRIGVSGKIIESRCMCACQTADSEKREQERKHREFLDMVAKNRSIGLPTRNCGNTHLKTIWDITPKQIDMAKKYVQLHCWTRVCR